jgi:hypothetical protein
MIQGTLICTVHKCKHNNIIRTHNLAVFWQDSFWQYRQGIHIFYSIPYFDMELNVSMWKKKKECKDHSTISWTAINNHIVRFVRTCGSFWSRWNPLKSASFLGQTPIGNSFWRTDSFMTWIGVLNVDHFLFLETGDRTRVHAFLIKSSPSILLLLKYGTWVHVSHR